MADYAAGDVALLHIARCIDMIVLQIDCQHYSEHLFIREEDEVGSMFREFPKKQPRSLQVSFAVDDRQLLCKSLLKALDSQVYENDAVR